MSAGRPSLYSPELCATICARIAEGESIRSICQDEGMPATSTVFLWLQNHSEFVEQYARAREAQADFMAEEALEIADDATNDWMERNNPDNPGWVQNGEAVARSRLRVDARKWFLSKVAPKKYGDKLVHSGDPENPLKAIAEIRVTIVDPNGSHT